MAISNISLATLRDDLKARIDEIAPDRFSPGELNRWLNVGQMETFIRIKDWWEVWYLILYSGTVNVADNGNDNVDLSGGNYMSTDIYKVQEFAYCRFSIWAACSISSDNTTVPIVTYQNLLEYKNSTLHGTADPKVSLQGSTLYGSEDFATDDAFQLLYVRKPVDMTSSLAMDLPDFCQDLVVMFAYQQCLRKLLHPTEDIGANISARLNELRQVFMNDMQIDKMQNEPTPKV